MNVVNPDRRVRCEREIVISVTAKTTEVRSILTPKKSRNFKRKRIFNTEYE